MEDTTMKENCDPAVVKKILQPGSLRDAVIEGLLLDLHRQCTSLCQKDYCSVLRGVKPHELISFTFEKLVREWGSVAPLLLRFLTTVANVTLLDEQTMPQASAPSVCTAGAVLLRQRNMHMSALHHIVGLILFHGNVSKLVCGIV